ncbi:MAG: hypothetical protein LH650_10655 [Chloroflexi bacterium]|nr:hypothetical protein [Chloroflexota bacterium]
MVAEHPAPTSPTSWTGSNLAFSEREAYWYETNERDDAVVDSRVLVSEEFDLFLRLGRIPPAPYTTPISTSSVDYIRTASRTITTVIRATTNTVTTFGGHESPFSTWPMLDAMRQGALNATRAFSWTRFLARKGLASGWQTPVASTQVDGSQAGDRVGTMASRDDVVAAIGAIKAMLDLTTEEVSTATSVGLRTIRRWHSQPMRPRRHTARSIWRLYTTARTLHHALGDVGTAAWLHAGSPSPMDLLALGDLVGFEGMARGRLLTRAAQPRYGGLMEEDALPSVADDDQPMRRAARRPKRGSLSAW